MARQLFRRLFSTARRSSRSPSRRSALLSVEALEDRTVPSVSIVDLGSPPNHGVFTPTAINNSGQVVGTAPSGTYPDNFLYSSGSYSFLLFRHNDDSLQAQLTALNNNGQAIGYFTNSTVGVTAGVRYDGQTDQFGFVEIYVLPSSRAGAMPFLTNGGSSVLGINDAGVAVGTAYGNDYPVNNTYGPYHIYAATWQPGTQDPTYLSFSDGAPVHYGTGIDNKGDIIGDSVLTGPPGTTEAIGTGDQVASAGPLQAVTAFILKGGSEITLPNLPGTTASVPTGISSDGDIIGVSGSPVIGEIPAGSAISLVSDQVGVIWRYDATTNSYTPQPLNFIPQAINGSSIVVGNGMVWTPQSGTLSLNQLLFIQDPNDGWTLTTTVGINDSNQITGTGVHNGVSTGYILSGLVLSGPIQWTGKDQNGLWSDAGNWLNGLVPQAGADLDFPAGAASTNTVDDLGYQFKSVSVEGNYTISGQTLTVSGLLGVQQGAMLTLSNTTGVSGTVTVAQNATLTVSGTLVASNTEVNGTLDDQGQIVNAEGAMAVNQGGTLTVEPNSTLDIKYAVVVDSPSTINGQVIVESDATLTLGVNGQLTGNGSITVGFLGGLTIGLGGQVFGPSTINVEPGGSADIEGDLDLLPGAHLNDQGQTTIGPDGGIGDTDSITITPSGTMDVFGTLLEGMGGYLNSQGTLIIEPGGTLDDFGRVNIAPGSVYSPLGTVTIEPGGIWTKSAGTPPLIVTGADAGASPQITVFNPDSKALQTAFYGLPQGFPGGARVALGDVNGDGTPDIIVGAGPGAAPQVTIYDGKTFQPFRSFFALPVQFTGGVFVAAGDVNGDGFADIIIAADKGGGPEVTIFDGRTGAPLTAFYATAPSFTGGIRVAAADLKGNGFADVIAVAGPGGGPQVTIFDGKTLSLLTAFYAFTPTFTGGLYVAAGDLTGSGMADIVVGAGPGGGPEVKVFNGQTQEMEQNFYALPRQFTGGVRVAVADVNGQGAIVAAAGPGGGPQVTVFDPLSLTELDSFFATARTFTGGLFVA